MRPSSTTIAPSGWPARDAREPSDVGVSGAGRRVRRRRARAARGGPVAPAPSARRGAPARRRRPRRARASVCDRHARRRRSRSGGRGSRRTRSARPRRRGRRVDACAQRVASPPRGSTGAARATGSPPPRSIRAGNVSAMSRQPVAARDAPGRRAGRPRVSASPPSSSVAGALGRRRSARGRLDARRRSRARAGAGAIGGHGPSASPHAQSAGTMSVATPPGGRRRGRDASARSPASASALRDVRTQHEHRAREALDVGLERRALAAVRRRVVADDAHDRRPRRGGVVEVGDPVRQPRARGAAASSRAGRPCARSRRRRRCRRPRTARGSGGRRRALERLHEVHLGRARVGEADVESGCRGGPQQGVRPGQSVSSS